MPATPKTKTLAAKAQPQPTPQALVPPDKPELVVNDFQRALLELAGDLIVRGGRQEDVDAFLGALISHQWNRAFYRPDGDKRFNPDVPSKLAKWRQCLESSWMRPWRAGEGLDYGDTLLERMRELSMLRLQWEFERICPHLSPEEIHVLCMVFNAYNQYGNVPGPDKFEAGTTLPDALMEEIRSRNRSVAAPPEMVDVLRKQVDLYLKAKEDARPAA